jgi:3-hydroxybutyryl-CoA dehydrogenase
MGPFELVDLVGLDTRLSILEYLHRSLGEKYRPCPLIAQYVKAGRLGRKVGRAYTSTDDCQLTRRHGETEKSRERLAGPGGRLRRPVM